MHPALNGHAPPLSQERRRKGRTPFRQNRRSAERISVLGVEVDLVRPEEVMHHIAKAVASNGKTFIANHNAHSIYLTRRNFELNEFFECADVIEVDSTPLIFFTRMLGLHSRTFHRCTYLDWRDHFWSVASRSNWRIFYLGGEPGVAALAAERLSARYPGVTISTRNGFFDINSEENDHVLAEIAAARAQILFVGMGMPRQELWIHRNREDLAAAVILSVGAAFDYEAGFQCPAPRWMGRLGIEWLFRLVGDPRRLFYRYCVEPWSLVVPAMRDAGTALVERRLFRSPRRAPPRFTRVKAQTPGPPTTPEADAPEPSATPTGSRCYLDGARTATTGK